MRPRRKNGYTLIEVMFAAAILATVIVTVGSAMTKNYQTNVVANDQVRAYKSAHQALEALLAMEFDEMTRYNNCSFSQVLNHEYALEYDPNNVDTTTEADQGETQTTANPSTTGIELVDYEPKTVTGKNVESKVFVTDLGWEGSTNRIYMITVRVDAFDVAISTVRARY